MRNEIRIPEEEVPLLGSTRLLKSRGFLLDTLVKRRLR
jgi:hypothetical protein